MISFSKRLFIFGLFTGSMLGLNMSAFAGDTLDRVMHRQLLTVATNSGWPPQSYLDERNELVGFDIDVSRELAKRLGIEVTFVTPDFMLMTGGHWGGRWDIAVGSITPTRARARVLDFPAAYYFSPYVFVVHKDSETRVRSDLNGKVIGIETGTTSEDYINRRLEIYLPDDQGAPSAQNIPEIEYTLEPGEVRTYPTTMMPFDDLRLGDGVRLDGVIVNEQTALRAIKYHYPVRILPDDYAFFEPLVIVADKGDPLWNQKIADLIRNMKADGTLKALTLHWFGKNYADDYDGGIRSAKVGSTDLRVEQR